MNSTDERNISALITQLAHRDAAERERTAAKIFACGVEHARRATAEWLRNTELAAHFVMNHSGEPQATVGVAVHRGDFEKIRAANGTPRLADVPPDIDAEEFELHFADEVRLDVLTARDARGDGAIGRFLSKRGPGIQQVELDVRQVDRATEILRAQFNLKPVYAEARVGADRTRVNFFLVDVPGGGRLLIELVEAPTGR